jgi:hypothetical protein
MMYKELRKKIEVMGEEVGDVVDVSDVDAQVLEKKSKSSTSNTVLVS